MILIFYIENNVFVEIRKHRLKFLFEIFRYVKIKTKRKQVIESHNLMDYQRVRYKLEDYK